MTGPVLAIEQTSLQVEPGGEVRARVRVTGDGPETERFLLEVLGDAARWAQLEPRHVSMPPGTVERIVEVVFRPPHSSAAQPKVVPFGVRALSITDRDRSALVEGDLLVTPVRDVHAGIEPGAAAGRWGAGYVVRLANRGIGPVPLRIIGADPTGALRFAVAPADPVVPPRGFIDVLVAVRTRHPKLAGRPARHPFGIEYRSEGGPSAGRLPAAFEQRPVLPAVVAALVALIIVATTVAGVLVFLPRTAARPAADQANQPGATPSAAQSSAARPPAPVNGFVVIYGPPTPVDDVVNKAAATQLLDRLRAAGADARIVDSRDSAQLDDGLKGLLVVLRDGFPDRAAATAECAARRAVAPGCVVVAPR